MDLFKFISNPPLEKEKDKERSRAQSRKTLIIDFDHVNKYDEIEVDNSHNKSLTVMKKIISSGLNLLVSCS